jgi:hypothetical protein
LRARLPNPGLHFGASSLRLVQLKDLPCPIEIDDVSVDDHLVFAGVVRNVVHVFDGVAEGAQLPKDKIDIYHTAG